MKKYDRIKNFIVIFFTILNIIALTFLSKVNFFISVCILALYIILLFTQKQSKLKTINKYVLLILVAFNLFFYLLNKFNILDYIGSVHEIKNFILSTKEWGIIAFVLIELLDVLVLPIPSFIIILAGVNIWGVTKTILICGITVIIGSCISFIIGKIWGTKAIEKIVGIKKYNEYKNVLNKHGKLYLSLMFIFPFFPDDLLCLLAGTTNIKLYEFVIISILTRPISIIVTALLGDYFINIFIKYSIGTVLSAIAIILILIVIITKYKNYISKQIKRILIKIRNKNYIKK